MGIDEVKVYIANTEPLEDERIFEHFYKAVSQERRDKTDRYRYPKDKRLSLAAEVLLKKALEQNRIFNFHIEKDENGKPYLLEYPSVKFNLSHSEERVMCVISGMEVGCDVEKMKETDFRFVKRFFTGIEYDWIDGKEERFFRLWTLKESFMKAVGLGMKLSLKDFTFFIEGDNICIEQSVNREQYFFKEFDLEDGYRYAVCTLQPEIGSIVEIDLGKI